MNTRLTYIQRHPCIIEVGVLITLSFYLSQVAECFVSLPAGANAALLLYDITNASTFQDIRGWLEGVLMSIIRIRTLTVFIGYPMVELKKNCPPELIIYIVGSKADLYRHRQVTSDLARLSLHNWFPPPRPPTPPPPPAPSTLSYIRPRFTSFPGLRSPTSVTPPPISPETPAYLDLPSSRASAVQRSKMSVQTRSATTGSLTRSTTSTGTRTPQSSRFGSHFGHPVGRNENGDNSSNSIEEADENEDEDEREWGLSKGMELFEVSAKDDLGKFLSIHSLQLVLNSFGIKVFNIFSTTSYLQSLSGKIALSKKMS